MPVEPNSFRKDPIKPTRQLAEHARDILAMAVRRTREGEFSSLPSVKSLDAMLPTDDDPGTQQMFLYGAELQFEEKSDDPIINAIRDDTLDLNKEFLQMYNLGAGLRAIAEGDVHPNVIPKLEKGLDWLNLWITRSSKLATQWGSLCGGIQNAVDDKGNPRNDVCATVLQEHQRLSHEVEDYTAIRDALQNLRDLVKSKEQSSQML